MKVNWKNKKVIAIIGGGITAVLTLSLGLGLGLGLQSDDTVPKYKILGQEYTESELVNDGVTNNGVTYEFKKKDDGLYMTIPTGTTFYHSPNIKRY